MKFTCTARRGGNLNAHLAIISAMAISRHISVLSFTEWSGANLATLDE